jgi:hypothetical protein
MYMYSGFNSNVLKTSAERSCFYIPDFRVGYMLILKIKYSELQMWNCLINLCIAVL